MALTKLTTPRALWITFKLKVAGAVSRKLYDKIIERGVSIKDFGAVGDGVADDTAAIVTALTFSHNLYIPEGVFLHSKITILGTTNVRLRGAGIGLSTLKSKEASGQSLTIEGSTKFIKSVLIEDLTIDGDGVATECLIYKCINAELNRVEVRGHVGKNIHILRSYQNNISHSRFIAETTAECCLYTATNALNITGQSYFNGAGAIPAIIVDVNEVGAPDCFNININGNVFESSPKAIKIADDIDTRNINIINNYFELVATTAFPLWMKGGKHTAINFKNNFVGGSCAAAAFIDRISSQSRLDIKGNTLYRPIILNTTLTLPATSLDLVNLPAITVDSQDITFENATVTKDGLRATIIIDEYLFAETLEVSIIRNTTNESYARVQGRTYRRSLIDTPSDLFNIALSGSGGTSYAQAFTANFDVSWRPASKAETGVNSFQAESHLVRLIARSTGTQKLAKSVDSLITESVALTTLDAFNDTVNSTINVVGTGSNTLPISEWFINFEIQSLI